MAKKIIVKSTDTKPTYLHLTSGGSLKIPARGQAEVEEDALNAGEIALYQSRGNIILVEASGAGESASAQEASQGETERGASPQPAGTANDAEGGEK